MSAHTAGQRSQVLPIADDLETLAARMRTALAHGNRVRAYGFLRDIRRELALLEAALREQQDRPS